MLICEGMRTISPALMPVLCIPGLIFEALVRLRGSLYSSALLPQYRLPGPVISIGNITAGGSGKTPLVIHVARMLLKLGGTPALLSRGYGRARPNESCILPPGKTVPSPAGALGDEPALVRRHLPSIWMGVSKNRFGAGNTIAGRETNPVFLLDDGFQHRRLHRDLDIVIIDRSQPLAANRLLPRGTLREPVSELRRCHVVVINGMPEKGKIADPLEEEIRSLHPCGTVFHCTQFISSLISFPSWKEHGELSAPSVAIRSAFLVAAVGNPGRFQRDFRRLGIEVRGTRFFPDHYWLTPKDWRACAEEARRKAADAIVTTEKDAVKISRPPDFPLIVCMQSTEIPEAGKFELVLKACIERRL
jgi:tetraacyldisaccharide 4'-kinase